MTSHVLKVRLRTNLCQGDAEIAGVSRSVGLLCILWRARVNVGRTIILGTVAATVVAFSLPSRFESTTRLMPPSAIETLDLDAGGIGDLAGTNRSGALWIDILKSRSVQDRMIERFDLKKIYGMQLMQTARAKLAYCTVLDEDGESGIISVTVTDKSAQRAAAMSNAYVEELDRVLSKQATTSAHQERLFLENRLKLVKLALDAAAREFGDFSSKNGTIDIDEQGTTLMESAAALNAQVAAGKSELAGLEQIYATNNPQIREESARIGELRSHLDSTDRKADSQPAELDESAQNAGSAYPSIRELPLLGGVFSDLSRNRETQENVYENLAQLVELEKIQEAREPPGIKILDIGSVAERQSFPPRFEIIFLGMLLSAGASVSWTLAKGILERSNPQNPPKTLVQAIILQVQTAARPSRREAATEESGFPRRHCMDK